MTTFLDGPAKGQHLMLKRAVMFLRVVRNAGGVWDALDQPDDEPGLDETLYAYVCAAKPGMCHINRGSKGSGFYPIAEYRFIEAQPAQEIMRNRKQWVAWCDSSRALVAHLVKDDQPAM